MEQKNNKRTTARKALRTIRLTTLVNGYALDIEKKGYMYRDELMLIKGMMIHLGLRRLEPMTGEEIQRLIDATKDGSGERLLQQEITELNVEIMRLKEELKAARKRIKELEY
jgi:hypothetical protein